MRHVPVSMVLGLALYGVSFSLPAVGTYRGWQCANIATAALIHFPDDFGQLMLNMAGLLNPLVAAFVLRELLGRLPAMRTLIPILIFISMAAARGYLFVFASEDLSVKIGHIFWIVGTLLIVTPEVGRWRMIVGRLGDCDRDFRIRGIRTG